MVEEEEVVDLVVECVEDHVEVPLVVVVGSEVGNHVDLVVVVPGFVLTELYLFLEDLMIDLGLVRIVVFDLAFVPYLDHLVFDLALVPYLGYLVPDLVIVP